MNDKMTPEEEANTQDSARYDDAGIIWPIKEQTND
jgi:hypothetical protein